MGDFVVQLTKVKKKGSEIMSENMYIERRKKELSQSDITRLYQILNDCNKIIFEAEEKRQETKDEIVKCFYDAGWLDCLEINTKMVDARWEVDI